MVFRRQFACEKIIFTIRLITFKPYAVLRDFTVSGNDIHLNIRSVSDVYQICNSLHIQRFLFGLTGAAGKFKYTKYCSKN